MPYENKTRIIITTYRGHRICARYVGFRMTDVTVIPQQEGLRIGDIVIGKVSRINPQMNAAFVTVSDGPDAYLSLDDPHEIIYTKGSSDTPLKNGDEILVQVTKEAHGSKNLSVSANLMFPGKTVLLMTGKPALGVSVKIRKDRKNELRHLLAPLMPEGFGIIVRTAAQTSSDAQIVQELRALTESAEEKISSWKCRTCFSVVERGPGETQEMILEHIHSGIDEIVTDLPDEYEKIRIFLNEEDDDTAVRLYDDPSMPLRAVYSLEKQISEALCAKVWLPSGAFIVIEQTEAMTVIDVNSGKKASEKRNAGKSKETAVFEVNAQAASEIARQIRLRNLSGIILIDFIDMAAEESQKRLLDILRAETAPDPAGVHVVDMTKLQLCEMTRKRARKPLREQLSLDRKPE